MSKSWVLVGIALLFLQSCFQKSESETRSVDVERNDKTPKEIPSETSAPNETPVNLDESNSSLIFSPNDPLFDLQWYLKNSGITPFGHGEWAINADINIENIFNQYNGLGQTIVISDSGIDLDHPDLENTDPINSKNYLDETTNDPTPTSGSDTHGTFVMGVVGATTNNDIGLVGVAPEANFVGYKFIGAPNTPTNFFDQMESTVPSTFNFSYGYPNCEVTRSTFFTNQTDYPLTLKHNTYSSNHIYVTAAGNDQFGDLESCFGTEGEVFIGNSNYNQDKIYAENIVVGATNSLGRPTRYTTPGSNVLLAAPGGEYHGFIIGLDLPGCTEGASKNTATQPIQFINDFETGAYQFNQNCDYTYSGMQGSSFSSPLVTGLISLIRQSCPSCNFRDIKYLIIHGANQIENFPTHSHFLNEAYPLLDHNLEGHDWDKGNIENNYGLVFNNFTGFGIIDVKETISLAEVYTNQVGELRQTVGLNLKPIYENTTTHSIPDNNASGVEVPINIDAHNFTVEHIKLDIRLNHLFPDEVGIEIISPAGTVSVVSYTNTDILPDSLNGEIVSFGVNAFYGENSLGEWKVKLIDGELNDSGTVDYIGLTISGGTWERAIISSTINPPENLSIDTTTGVVLNFDYSNLSEILRFEYCATEVEKECLEHHWIDQLKSSNQINLEGHIDKTWQSFESGKDYKIKIRAIGLNEETSEEVETSWRMP